MNLFYGYIYSLKLKVSKLPFKHTIISMKIILFLFAIILVETAIAQQKNDQFTSTIGGLSKEEKTRSRLEYVAKVENGYLVFKKQPIRGPKGYSYQLAKLDQNLKEVKFQDISEHIAEEDFTLDQVILMKNSFVLLSSKHFRSEKKTVFYAQFVDFNTFKVSQRIELMEEEITGRAEKMNFQIDVNDSGEELVIVKRRWNTNSDDSYIAASLFDGSLNIIGSERKIQEKKAEEGILILNKVILHEDLTFNVLTNRKVKDEKIVDLIYSVVTADPDGNAQEFDLVIENNKFGSVDMRLKNDKDLYITGYYYANNGKRLTANQAEGVALFKINAKSGDIVEQSINDFNIDFIKEGHSDKFDKAAQKREDDGKIIGIGNLKMKDVVFAEDGRVFAIGQVTYSITTSSTVNGVTTRTTTYYYEDIIVSEFNAEGEWIGNTKIPYSSSQSSPSAQFRTFSFNDNFIFILTTYKSHFIDNFYELPRKERKAYEYNVLYYFEFDSFTGDDKSDNEMLLMEFQDETSPIQGVSLDAYVDFDGKEEFILFNYSMENLVRFERNK